MRFIKFLLFLLSGTFMMIALLSGPVSTQAQRISYQDLLHQSRESHIYMDHFTLPEDQSNRVLFITTFRIDYSRLMFRKRKESNSSGPSRGSDTFEAKVSVSLELFESAPGEVKNGKKLDETDIQSLTPIKRKFWKQTAVAQTYEQTQSHKHFVSGFLDVALAPGNYKMLVEVTDETASDQSFKRVRPVKLAKSDLRERLSFYFVDSLNINDKPQSAQFANFGKNVNYGQDFHLLTQLPAEGESNFTVKVHQYNIQDRDTSRQENVFNHKISKSDIYPSLRPRLKSDSTTLNLEFRYDGSEKYSYGLIKIPNSTFENGYYQIRLIDDSSKKVLHKEFYQSRWLNMPVSLLNIDVALRMLEFIVSEEKLDQMLDGSKEERIEAFKQFWGKKDPTPQTAFNELMAEYYQRIDHAYEKFSSVRQPGYETDMGRIYIRRGPPNGIERKFPSDDRAIEIWSYPDKTFIFRATSGFGDFELVSEK